MFGKPGNMGRSDFRATLGGFLFLMAFMLLGLAAINTQRALLFVLFGLMVGTFFTSVGVARRMLSGVEVLRDVPERAFARSVVYLGYQLRHRRRSGLAVGLEIREVHAPPALESSGGYCLCLRPGETFKSGSRFLVRRRGRFRLTGVRLSTHFPFSLLHAHRDIPQEASLVVWPALGSVRADVLARGAAEVSDAAPARAQSGADEFFGLREYRTGDNPRWIHWKRTAATGAPVVREMTKPPPDALFVVLDALRPGSSSADRRELELLLRFAATLLEHAFRREYRIGLALALPGGVRVLPPSAGKGQRIAVLDALADVDAGAETPFAALLGAIPRRLLSQAHVVVVGVNPPQSGDLNELRATCRRLTVVTSAALGQFYADEPEPLEVPAERPRRRAEGR